MADREGRRRRRAMATVLAAGTALLIAVGAWLVPASAVEDDEFRAAARILSGQALHVDLDDVAALASVEIENLAVNQSAPAGDGGAEVTDASGGNLPDTGGTPNRLLTVGLGLMLAGALAAYAVNRRRDTGQG